MEVLFGDRPVVYVAAVVRCIAWKGKQVCVASLWQCWYLFIAAIISIYNDVMNEVTGDINTFMLLLHHEMLEHKQTFD